MGLPRPPAFLDPNLDEDTILEKGVNYASGGGGILNETGSYFVSINVGYSFWDANVKEDLFQVIERHNRSHVLLLECLACIQIQRLCFQKQLELFRGTQELITYKLGKNESRKFFRNAAYVVALGANDFINNYLMPVYGDSWKYNDQTFVDYLIETLEGQLKVCV